MVLLICSPAVWLSCSVLWDAYFRFQTKTETIIEAMLHCDITSLSNLFLADLRVLGMFLSHLTLWHSNSPLLLDSARCLTPDWLCSNPRGVQRCVGVSHSQWDGARYDVVSNIPKHYYARDVTERVR